jgi:hypothetical protein
LSSARHKLNAAYFQGSLIVTGLIGAIGGSWNVFILVAAVLTATSALRRRFDSSDRLGNAESANLGPLAWQKCCVGGPPC